MTAYPSAFDHPHVILVRSQAIAADLDSYLSRIDPDDARLATSYVFQIPPGLREELSRSQPNHVRVDLLARTSDRNLFTLTYSSDRHELCRITTTGLELLESAEMESALRRVCEMELHRLVEKAVDRCFYRATPRYHFVAPSGRHCSIFLRVGDIITSRDALERFAFWILPAVANAGAILVDNWSIASVALRALQLQGLDVSFDCLSYHPHQDRRDADVVIGDLIQSLPSGKGLLCLISVASSGRYTEVVRQIAKDFNLQDDRLRFLGLYRLRTETSLDALCDLEESPDNYRPADCVFCHAGSKPVALHPALYYWKEVPEEAVLLQRPHFSNNVFIVKHHERLDLLSVHRDDRNGRHHAFHVDVASLLHDSAFQETFLLRLRELNPRPEIVVTPQDDVSSMIGETASQELVIPHVAIDLLRNLAILQETDREWLNSATRLLIVDDVLVSGARIEGYNKALRERQRPLEAVHFLVGLARPTSHRAWSNLRTALTTHVPWKANLNAVETLFLPDWRQAQCPWCREFEFLSRLASLEPDPPAWLKQRLARLTERERGMREEPLLVLPNVSPRTLGNGSLAGPEGMSSMATLFSVASALQALRNEDDNSRRLNPYFPAFQVFGIRNLKNYSEGLLRSVLLRTVLPGEWSETIEVAELEQFLLEAARAQDQDIILGEVIIAAVRGSIDKSVVSAIEEELTTYLGKEAYSSLEQALLSV